MQKQDTEAREAFFQGSRSVVEGSSSVSLKGARKAKSPPEGQQVLGRGSDISIGLIPSSRRRPVDMDSNASNIRSSKSMTSIFASNSSGFGSVSMTGAANPSSEDSTIAGEDEEEEMELEPYPPNLQRGVKVIKKNVAGKAEVRRLYVHGNTIELVNPEKRRFRSQSKMFALGDLTAVVAQGERSLSLSLGAKELYLTLADRGTRAFMWQHLRKMREEAREKAKTPRSTPASIKHASTWEETVRPAPIIDARKSAAARARAPDAGKQACHACGRPSTKTKGSSTRDGDNAIRASPMLCYAVRLLPGEELKSALAALTSEMSLKAGFVVSCVGSVRDVALRLAGAERPSPDDSNSNIQNGGVVKDMLYPGADVRFEVLSLVGTLSPDGLHLHVSLGDDKGAVCGGHLVSAIVHTTAEIVIGEAPALSFSRSMDDATGFKELVVRARGSGV